MNKNQLIILIQMIIRQIISVNMDLKRNYSSNIQPPTQIKVNPLLNPLINISNASTPVRTRIIKPGNQLNCGLPTTHKIGIPIKSPTINNKQNDQGNTKSTFNKPQIIKTNINLSPIMALNRKINDGPKGQQRTFINSQIKKIQPTNNCENNQKYYQKHQQAFGVALRQSKNSNGFKSMLESRSKTPTKPGFPQSIKRQGNQGSSVGLGIQQYGSANNLLQQGMSPKMRDSRSVKLGQSRSFEQLINLGTPIARESQVLCSNSNDHEKKVKAKYKVVEEPPDDELLVYCSKCAINLVKKGFRVEDLTAEDIEKIKRKDQQQWQIQNKYSNQYCEYGEQTNRKIHLKLNQLSCQKKNLVALCQKQIDDVECYYNSIISMVQQQKRKDKQTFLSFLQKQSKNGQILQRKLHQASTQLTYMIRNTQLNDQNMIIIQQMQSLLTEKGFSHKFDSPLHLVDNVQFKFDLFSQYFTQQGKLKIQNQHQQYQHQQLNIKQYYSNKQIKEKNQSPFRFSFEKSIKEGRRNNFGFRGGMMNPLEEAPQAMEGEDSVQIFNQQNAENDKKAFRTLFPEDEEEPIQEGQKQAIHSPTFKQI